MNRIKIIPNILVFIKTSLLKKLSWVNLLTAENQIKPLDKSAPF